MMDCYNRCLCITCLNNETCKEGCNMCQGLKVCRFAIVRGKCKNYKPDRRAIVDKLTEEAKK